MLNKDECPRGIECGVHYRLSDHILTDERVSLIDYVGDKAVFTTLNDPGAMLDSALRGETPIDAFTYVYQVGDGVIGDIMDDLKLFEKSRKVREEIYLSREIIERLVAGEFDVMWDIQDVLLERHTDMVEVLRMEDLN